MRLSQVAKILNRGIPAIASSLSAKGFKVDNNPNAKIAYDQLEILAKEYKNNELLSKATAPKPVTEPMVAEPYQPAPRPAETPRREENTAARSFREESPKPVVAQPEAARPEPVKPVVTPTPTAQPEVVQPPVARTETPEPPKVEAPAPKPEPVVQVTQPTPAPAPAPKPEPTPEPAPVQAPAPVEARQPQPEPQPVASAPAPTPVVAAPATPAPAVTAQPQQPAAQPQSTPAETEAPKEDSLSGPRLPGLTVLGKIDLNRKPNQPSSQRPSDQRRPDNRQQQPSRNENRPQDNRGQQPNRPNDRRPGGSNNDRDRRPDQGRTDRPGNYQGNRPERPVTPGAPTGRPDQPRAEQDRSQDNRSQTPRPTQPTPRPEPTVDQPQEESVETIRARGEQLRGLTVLGTIELPSDKSKRSGGGPVASTDDNDKKRKRKRLRKDPVNEKAGTGTQPGNGPRSRDNQNQNQTPNQNQNTANPANRAPGAGNKPGTPNTSTNAGAVGGKKGGRNTRDRRDEPTEREVKDSIKATQSRMLGNRTNRGADRRRDRRQERAERERERAELEQEDAKVLRVTEFVSANDLASLMDVSVNEVISVCMSLGMFVSINQRLDAEAITVLADEFGYDIQFVSAEEEIESEFEDVVDAEEDLVSRAPIVTIMGHVDHGKTSLLDYIRRARVAAGEAGGITQHIGAYSVKTDDGRMITFLDTPGHEAFTAMRARGAKVTDVVIIVIAADDSVMPQTREAINHAQAAGVPIVFAFSKVDKPGANAEKIREELANMNLLVEEWGGKYQTQEISSKSGMGIPELLEKVLLEAELLDLKANPDRRATGTVIEASLDKGRGYVTTILVETGTLRIGDVMLVGAHFGRIRAMTDDRGQRIKEAGPSTPVQILGLPGAPQAGDKFNVMESEREARELANKREQLLREQNLRTRKHITLEEIGRRKAIGSFKELNVIVKGDVDGSVEALSDSLLQLSTEEVQVNIIQKAVGQISESDVLLASASDAIIVGFQVRPSASARRLAEQEQIEIRLYSIIYDAINEVRDAMEGLLAPTTEEVIVGNIEIREVFRISKVGTVAGCYVTDGLIKRNNKIRVIRDFIVVHTGEISALKRFKDDVGEVRSGYECGLSIKNFNDLEVGDTIESFELKEVKRTL